MKEIIINLPIFEEFNKKSIKEYLDSFYIRSSFYNNLINNKKILLNNQIVKSANQIVESGDLLKMNIQVKEVRPYKYKIKVLYEDKFLIVINKSGNILVHSDGNTNETLTNAVYNYLYLNNDNLFAYPIHRLDYETTGIVVFAKDPFSLAYMSKQIEEHNVVKEYVCLCRGEFSKFQGVITSKIAKDRHSNKQIVNIKGKDATTKYKVIKNGSISKVLVNIEHGRKHQIRVHLASIKHPICGDKLYGYNETEDLKLHFKKISFIHPFSRKRIVIECKEEF